MSTTAALIEQRVLDHYRSLGAPCRTYRVAQALGLSSADARIAAHRLATRQLLKRSPLSSWPAYMAVATSSVSLRKKATL